MKNLGWKALIGTVSAWLAIGSAQAQLVPEKPIRWLVPYAAGGASDMVARLVAQEMNTAATAGNVFVIDNKPGAASIVASQILVQSKADGHTVMTASFDTLSANPNFFRKIPYRWDQDFAFIGFIAKLPLVLVARPDSGIAQADDFVQYMSQHAKSLSYATWGHGTISHLGIELLSNSAAATMLHVPFNGSAVALQSLMAGQTDLFLVDVAVALPYIKSKAVKALAVSTAQRSSLLPDVKTMQEAGAKDYDLYQWFSLVAPRQTPPATVEALARQLNQTLAKPGIRQALVERAVEPFQGSPAEVMQRASLDKVKVAKIMQERNIPPNE